MAIYFDTYGNKDNEVRVFGVPAGWARTYTHDETGAKLGWLIDNYNYDDSYAMYIAAKKAGVLVEDEVSEIWG